jgi:glycosyltransferase involved in cell wall biosynthesis
MPLKIGFFSQPFDDCGPDPRGSIGIVTWELSRRLARSTDVLVGAPLTSGRLAKETCEGVRFIRVSLRADLKMLFHAERTLSFLKSHKPLVTRSFYYLLYAIRIARAMSQYRCDVIHIHNFSQFIPIARAFNPNAKIVLHMSATWLAEFDRGLIDSRLKKVDAIVGCSEYISQGIRRRFPHHAQQCVTVFNGVDTDSFMPFDSHDGEFVPGRIIFIGRISPEKGLHVLLDAFKLVAARRPQASLQIVGAPHVAPSDFVGGVGGDPAVKNLARFYVGPGYIEQLRKQISGPLEDRVVFSSEVPHDRVKSVLHSAAMLVQPSLVETFGMPVAEAMACGLPVVASRIGGLPEIVVNGQTGLLVQPDNTLQLAEAILQLIEDSELSRTMGKAGRIRAEQLFSWSRVAASFDSLYSRLCNSKGASNSSLYGPPESSKAHSISQIQ